MSLATQGYEFLRAFASPMQIDLLLRAIEAHTTSRTGANLRNADQQIPAIAALAQSAAITQVVQQHLSAQAQLLRVIFFNKSIDNNWQVSWHEDRSLALDNVGRCDNTERYPSSWGKIHYKEGLAHIQPPAEILQQLLTLRLHLDKASPTNGSLKILPGTHRLGIIPEGEISALSKTMPAINCAADAGDLLLMKPLVLHASAKATLPGPRRVIHMEFGDIGALQNPGKTNYASP